MGSGHLAYRPIPDEEDKLRRRLRDIAREHPRWRWKTAHSILLREGWTINRKRTPRLWRSQGLAGRLPASASVDGPRAALGETPSSRASTARP